MSSRSCRWPSPAGRQEGREEAAGTADQHAGPAAANCKTASSSPPGASSPSPFPALPACRGKGMRPLACARSNALARTPQGRPSLPLTCQHGQHLPLGRDHSEGGPGGDAQLAPQRHAAVVHHRVLDFVAQHCRRGGGRWEGGRGRRDGVGVGGGMPGSSGVLGKRSCFRRVGRSACCGQLPLCASS